MFASPAAQSLRGDTGYPALSAVVPASVYGETNPGFSKNVFDNKFSSFPSSAPVFGENFASFADAGALQPGMSPDVVTLHVKFPKDIVSVSEGEIVFVHSPKVETRHGTQYLIYSGTTMNYGDQTAFTLSNDGIANNDPISVRSYFCGIAAGNVTLKNGIGFVPLAYQNTVPIKSGQTIGKFKAGDRVEIFAEYSQNPTNPNIMDITFGIVLVGRSYMWAYDESQKKFRFVFAEGVFLLDTNPNTQSTELIALTKHTPYINDKIRNIETINPGGITGAFSSIASAVGTVGTGLGGLGSAVTSGLGAVGRGTLSAASTAAATVAAVLSLITATAGPAGTATPPSTSTSATTANPSRPNPTAPPLSLNLLGVTGGPSNQSSGSVNVTPTFVGSGARGRPQTRPLRSNARPVSLLQAS